MPEATPAAALAAQPAPQPIAPASAATAKVDAAATKGPPAEQTKPLEPAKPDAATLEANRRAATLAAAKREEKRIREARQKFEQERTGHAEQLKKAAELDRLAALQKSDPVKFAKEIGLDISDLSRKYLTEVSGKDKTPAEIARQVYEEQRKLELAAAKEAGEKESKAAELRAQQQAIAGGNRAMADIIKSDAERFDLCAKEPSNFVQEQAWLLIKSTWDASKGTKILPYDKALDGVEKWLLDRNSEKLKSSPKLRKTWEEIRKAEAEAEKAAKAAAKKEAQSSPKIRGSAAPSLVGGEEKSPPNPNPNRKRMLMPTEQRRIAQELWESHAAKQDN